MKVSQRTEYGIRAMVALARDFDSVVSIRELAARESIPEPFLEQIMADLRRRGLLESVRGARGGYRLKQEPGKISLGKVMEILEGSLSLGRCGPECVRQDCCSSRSAFDLVGRSISETLDGIYLKDLAARIDYE